MLGWKYHVHLLNFLMKFTQYFLSTRQRSDRASVKIDWIKAVVDNPVKEVIQEDGVL
ncbi:MAG: hypothetical protein IPL99_19225 [Candidatus Competibacteraceae bacterium]|nr:hypothetical protein [Candidatus Competibacteraceae bacterium]